MYPPRNRMMISSRPLRTSRMSVSPLRRSITYTIAILAVPVTWTTWISIYERVIGAAGMSESSRIAPIVNHCHLAPLPTEILPV